MSPVPVRERFPNPYTVYEVLGKEMKRIARDGEPSENTAGLLFRQRE